MSKIALVSAVKDCLPLYLKHWTEYHLSIGFDHIFLYDNDSEEPIRSRNSQVTVTKWPGAQGQLDALRAGAKDVKDKGYEWVSFLDDDEYLVCPSMTVGELVAHVPYERPGLSMNMRTFGSSGLFGPVPDGNTTSAFTACLPEDATEGNEVRFLSRVARISSVESTGHCRYLGDALTVSTAGKPVSGGKTKEPHFSTAWINHYSTRSRWDFMRKMARGRGRAACESYSEELLHSLDKRCTETYTAGVGKVVS